MIEKSAKGIRCAYCGAEADNSFEGIPICGECLCRVRNGRDGVACPVSSLPPKSKESEIEK